MRPAVCWSLIHLAPGRLAPGRLAPGRLALFLGLTLGAAGCGDSHLRRGDDALGLGRYEEAVAAYDSAIATDESAHGPPAGRSATRERLASAHRSFAMALLEQGKCQAARPHFSEAEKLTRPVLVDYQQLYECGVARAVSLETQVEDLRKLVALGDRRATVLRKLMNNELALGRDDDAVSRLDALQKRSVLTLDERRRLAEVLLKLNRREEAWGHLKATVDAGPADPINRLKLAELAEERGEKRIAQDIYEKMTVELPENPLTWLRLAAFRLRVGDQEGARTAQARADALRASGVPPAQEMRPLRKSRH